MTTEEGKDGDEVETPDVNTPKQKQRSDWVEIICAVLLALATIATAWSGYQATRWGGVMTIKFSEANAARVNSARSLGQAYEQITYDIDNFTDYAEARTMGNTVLEEYIRDYLFRPEFKEVVDAWWALDPANNPDAPRKPFDMPEYENKFEEESAEFDELAKVTIEEAKEANQRGDNYVLLTVIFASVLFFAGIASKFKGQNVRIGLTFFGYAVFIVALLIVIQMPVH